MSRSARSPFSTQGVQDQLPGFFLWFFEYASRGSQVPHCAQGFPVVPPSAAVTAADILAAASTQMSQAPAGSDLGAADFDCSDVWF